MQISCSMVKYSRRELSRFNNRIEIKRTADVSSIHRPAYNVKGGRVSMNDYSIPQDESAKYSLFPLVDRVLNQPGFAGEYSPQPPMYSVNNGSVEIRCEHCTGVMLSPIQEAALVWYPNPTNDYVIYTGFHITHKSSHCIDNLFKGTVSAYWMPLDTFYHDGMLSLDWFMKPRYDDYGDLIDADLRIDTKSLDRVTPAMVLLNRPVKTRKQTAPRKRTSTEGYVYLVQSVTGAYKIGRTIDPNNRLKTFNVKLPFEVEYVVTIKTPNMYQLETDLHNQFAEKRVNGEWFNLSPADVNYIKGLAS